MKKIDLSVIIPFFNEEENLGRLHKELVSVLNELELRSEIIYVDDGSTDSSKKLLINLVKNEKLDNISVEVIEFMKNFGQTAAISAGINVSKGKYISFLDSDLQNDPRDIPRFLEKLDEGYDAVVGWRKDRKDATVRSLLSRVANLIINKIFSYPFNDVGCSARVVKKGFMKDIQLYGELHRVVPVLIYLKGAKIGEIVVKHRERMGGKSKYGFERIIKTVIDLITVKFLHSYGTKPAYVFGSAGLVSIVAGMFTLILVVYRKLFLGVYIHKDPLFLITIFLVLLGTQFMLMGLLAELSVRTYFESQKKPIYEIRKSYKY